MSHVIVGNVYPASEGERFAADTELRVVQCYRCHVTYAIPESFYQSAREHNAAKNPSNYWRICCPFGHQWHYTGLNEEQRLARNLERERERSGRLAHERDQLEASRRAERAAKTRIKKERDRERLRVAAGVCPCCNRNFKDVRRHMKSQHPDFGHDHE